MLGSAVSAFAQAPQVNSVVNFASVDNRLSPGSLAIVTGSGFAAGTPTATVTQGANVRSAWVSPTNANQLTVQIPVDAVAGPATFQVTVAGSSASIAINLSNYAPGVLSRDSTGTGTGSFLHVNNGLSVGLRNPAVPGETIYAFVVGLGPTNPAVGTGVPAPPSPLANTLTVPTVRVGGVQANVTSSVLFPLLVGFYRVGFVVPAGLPKGRYPVVISIAGHESNTVELPVVGPFVLGDFNSDDKPDLIWQKDSNRETWVWY
ncbi:MAG: hypothetical protein ACRD7E_28210, partial [Bryobacteraceae bacterium]